MQGMSSFYIGINIALFAYACYSWYWQAQLELKGKYRFSIVIGTIFIIWLGFTWNYIEQDEPGISVFLALLMITSIVDGFTGFTSKKAVISGYFKRTVPYSEIDRVMLINVPSLKKPSVICILGTNKGRQYNLQFSGDANRVVEVLRKYADHNIEVEVRNTLK